MWVNINNRWHAVAWTDPDFISVKGEMLHKTRCGLLKIRLSFREAFPGSPICARCKSLLAKDEA